MQVSTKITIAAVLAIIVGPILAYNGHVEKQRLAQLEKEGVTVDGIIEGGESRKGRKRASSYNLEVAFTPVNGVPMKQNFAVTSDFFAAHTNESAITDPAVKVRYLASEIQDSAILVGGSTDSTFMFPFGLGALGLGSLTALGMFMRRK